MYEETFTSTHFGWALIFGVVYIRVDQEIYKILRLIHWSLIDLPFQCHDLIVLDASVITWGNAIAFYLQGKNMHSLSSWFSRNILFVMGCSDATKRLKLEFSDKHDLCYSPRLSTRKDRRTNRSQTVLSKEPNRMKHESSLHDQEYVMTLYWE